MKEKTSRGKQSNEKVSVLQKQDLAKMLFKVFV